MQYVVYVWVSNKNTIKYFITEGTIFSEEYPSFIGTNIFVTLVSNWSKRLRNLYSTCLGNSACDKTLEPIYVVLC